MTLEHSRAARLAARASGQDESELERRLSDTSVTVSVDPDLPGGLEAARILAETLRRLPLELHLDQAGLPAQWVAEASVACAAIDDSRPLVVGRANGLAVHIGVDERAPLRVIPDGYGARLRRDGVLQQSRAANGLGVLFAAAIAAAELFKDAADVLPTRQIRHQQLHFCPVTLGDDLEQAPELGPTTLELGLVGVGAVGTATARILGMLPLSGRVLVIDPEPYALENLGTYSLGTRIDAETGRAKVALAADALANFNAVPFVGRVEDALGLIDSRQLPWPRVVLSGLDSVAARHATQSLWPDYLIDAATGDTALGVHEARDGGACMMCFFPPHADGASALTRLVNATQLTPAQLADGDRLLAEEDLHDLDDEHRELLRPHVGTAVCGLANAIGLTAGGDDSYLPSVPFVSQQAACLGVGRLVARLLGLEDLPNLVQYDALRGPQTLTALKVPPVADCYSVTNREVIDAVRKARQRLTASA